MQTRLPESLQKFGGEIDMVIFGRNSFSTGPQRVANRPAGTKNSRGRPPGSFRNCFTVDEPDLMFVESGYNLSRQHLAKETLLGFDQLVGFRVSPAWEW